MTWSLVATTNRNSTFTFTSWGVFPRATPEQIAPLLEHMVWLDEADRPPAHHPTCWRMWDRFEHPENRQSPLPLPPSPPPTAISR